MQNHAHMHTHAYLLFLHGHMQCIRVCWDRNVHCSVNVDGYILNTLSIQTQLSNKCIWHTHVSSEVHRTVWNDWLITEVEGLLKSQLLVAAMRKRFIIKGHARFWQHPELTGPRIDLASIPEYWECVG